MLISLLKASSSQPGEILVHVEVSEGSASDDLPFTYSHSFRYKVSPNKDSEVIVYTDKGAVNGTHYPFNLEKCLNKDCRKEHPDRCPEIAGKTNPFLVADAFHTRPIQDSLQFFGTALFKALFSGVTRSLLKVIEPTHPNGSIFLQLGDRDLDTIPWEYAKDDTSFLVHQRKFTRLLESPQDPLPKLPLHIIVITPNPLDLIELGLADLRPDDQFQNFISEFHGDSTNVTLERVLPATVKNMNSMIAKPDDKMASVLHFMGHCVAHKNENRGRALLFEDRNTFKCKIVDIQSLITVPRNLRLVFLAACDSREVARDLAQNGIRHTVGWYHSIPDDIARKSEAQYYHYLSQGLPADEAMWRMRMDFRDSSELRQSDYLAGAMILYSTTCRTADSTFLCEPGKLTIKRNISEPSIPDIQNWNKEQVVEHLRNKFPNDVSEGALNILLDNEIGGRAFLGLTKEDLMSDGVKRGPAHVIADYVKKLNATQTD